MSSFRRISQFLIGAAAVAASAFASAQSISWRVPNFGIEANVGGIAKQSLVFDGTGNVYAATYVFAAFDAASARVSRYAIADGQLAWQVDVPASGWVLGYIETGFQPSSAALAQDGGDVVVASTIPGAPFAGRVGRLRGSDGASLWQATDPTVWGAGYEAVAVDANGDVIAAGAAGIPINNATEGRVAKYRGSDGAPLWQLTFDDTLVGCGYSFAFTQVAVDANGDVIAAGSSYVYGSGQTAAFCVAKFAGASGTLLWAQNFTPSTPPVGRAWAISASTRTEMRWC